jgi:cell division protein FtsI/penicillin-binding protein 2
MVTRIRRPAITDSKIVQKRIALLLSAILLSTVVLVGRIAWIQFIQGNKLKNEVQEQLMDYKMLQSPRGTIFDRNGQELAVSSLVKSLFANPAELNYDTEALARLLAPILGMEVSELKEKLTTNSHFVWLKRTLEPAVSDEVKALMKEQNIKGIGFIEESKRYYPNDNLAAHIIGFIGTDDVGLDGIEMSLDKSIKGDLAELSLETDRYGVPIFKSARNFIPRKQGKSVI